MISETAKYALRAVVCLAAQTSDYVRRSDIANSTGVPHDYLLKVLNELDSAGIVESRRGPGGGYRLLDDANEVTVLQVVLAVDEIPRIEKCPLGIPGHENLCPLHRLLDTAGKLVEEQFAAVTIQDLLPSKRKTRSCQFPRSNSHRKPRAS